MKHINVDNQSEEVKHFLLSLDVDPQGSILELNGKELLRVAPVDPLRSNRTTWRPSGAVSNKWRPAWVDYLKTSTPIFARVSVYSHADEPPRADIAGG